MKKRIYISFLVLVFFATAISSAQENKLAIRFKDGTTELLKINSLKKLRFSPNILYINYIDEITKIGFIENISQMHFEYTTDVVQPSGNAKSFVYPNPTTGRIFFKGLPEEMVNLRIFNMSGMQVFSARINASVESLDVSFLAQGIYFISMNNEQTKLIKL